MRSSSPFIARAVRAITGMAHVAWSPLSSAVAWRPSIPGSWMSIRIRLGCSSRASINPASASVALSTAWPADCRRKTANVMFVGLSSMIKTLAMSGHHLAARHGPPHFDREAFTVEVVFLHDHRHGAVELAPVLGADLAGRHD